MGAGGVWIIHQPHHGWCLLILSPSSTTTAFALALAASNLASNFDFQACDEPLPSIEGCGLHQHRFGSLTSEDAALAVPPLFKGMWAAKSRSTEDPGREEDAGDPWRGRPRLWVTKHEPRRLSWSVFVIHPRWGGENADNDKGRNDAGKGGEGGGREAAKELETRMAGGPKRVNPAQRRPTPTIPPNGDESPPMTTNGYGSHPTTEDQPRQDQRGQDQCRQIQPNDDQHRRIHPNGNQCRPIPPNDEGPTRANPAQRRLTPPTKSNAGESSPAPANPTQRRPLANPTQ